jgi:flavin-dependent dehydrogenase
VTLHESMSCDVLVLGAGMAGLSAAGYAAEHGANVIVLERAGSIGGSALLSGGILWTATSPKRMHLYGGGIPELGEVVLRNYAVGLAWMRRRAVAISPAVPVLHGRGYQIDILDHLRGCSNLVEQHGGHVVLDTDTQELLRSDSGAVTGARIGHADGVIDVHAAATILATGGYQNSAEMRAQYIHANARDKLLLRTNPISRATGCDWRAPPAPPCGRPRVASMVTW